MVLRKNNNSLKLRAHKLHEVVVDAYCICDLVILFLACNLHLAIKS